MNCKIHKSRKDCKKYSHECKTKNFVRDRKSRRKSSRNSRKTQKKSHTNRKRYTSKLNRAAEKAKKIGGSIDIEKAAAEWALQVLAKKEQKDSIPQSGQIIELPESDGMIKDAPNTITGGIRDVKSYTHSLNDVLNVITIQKDVLPVGSFKYNIHKYPGDIDIFERIMTCCGLEDAKKTVAREIQNVVNKIKLTPNMYLGEFKAGKDKRFDIDIGAWSENFEDLNGYNSIEIQKKRKELFDKNLLSVEENKHLESLIVPYPTYKEWENIDEFIHDFTTIRWTANEVTQGYKKLVGDVHLTLEDAISQKTIVKIDLWARVNGRYIEISNFLMLSAVDPTGKVKENLTKDLPDYAKSIARDVKFYSLPEHRNTLKALKRLWSLSLFNKNYELSARISPLFSTRAAALHQINGEAEVLAKLLKQIPNPPMELIIEQIESFKPRIDQLNDKPEHNDELFDLINSVTLPFYKKETYNFGESADKLDKLRKMLGKIIESVIYEEAVNLGVENPADLV